VLVDEGRNAGRTRETGELARFQLDEIEGAVLEAALEGELQSRILGRPREPGSARREPSQAADPGLVVEHRRGVCLDPLAGQRFGCGPPVALRVPDHRHVGDARETLRQFANADAVAVIGRFGQDAADDQDPTAAMGCGGWRHEAGGRVSGWSGSRS
jgi:hypothetical protein